MLYDGFGMCSLPLPWRSSISSSLCRHQRSLETEAVTHYLSPNDPQMSVLGNRTSCHADESCTFSVPLGLLDRPSGGKGSVRVPVALLVLEKLVLSELELAELVVVRVVLVPETLVDLIHEKQYW